MRADSGRPNPEEMSNSLAEGDYAAESVVTDPLDDVFGADDGDALMRDDGPSTATHPSDMMRLQKEHATAGYREGVSVAKETSIQAGFDEGFSLGATIGQAAGELLGLLEGISEALKDTGSADAIEAETLYSDAKNDLSTDTIFSKEFWAEDGNWTYDVVASSDTGVVFPDVAQCHPMIKKWTANVDKVKKDWAISQPILDAEVLQPTEVADAGDDSPPINVPQSANKALDW